MVTYSEWIQDPDYTQRASRGIGELGDYGTVRFGGYGMASAETVEVRPWGDDYAPVDPALWDSQLNTLLRTDLEDPGDDGTPVSNAATYVSFIYEPTETELRTRQGLTIRRHNFTVQPPSSPFTIAPWPRPTDAIGIEYEGRPYDPDNPFPGVVADEVGLAIHGNTQLEGITRDSTYGPEVGGDYFLPGDAAPPSVLRVAIGGVDVSTASIPGRRQEQPEDWTLAGPLGGGSVDISDVIPESESWVATVWTETPTVVAPFQHDSGFGDTQYGWTITRLVCEWTLRPVPYRWVFADETSIVPPIRRTFPRPDGRAGGAPRTFPPSPTIQSGNRTSGAIF